MKLSTLISLLQAKAATHGGDIPVSSYHSNGFVEPVTELEVIGAEEGNVLLLKSCPFYRDKAAPETSLS